MMSNDQARIQRAVAFFRQPEWSRLMDELYKKYMRQGRIAGRIVLQASSVEERREVASFLKKRLPPEGDVTVQLADLQKALYESSFACEIGELLQAFFPERPQITNPQRRETQASEQEKFYEQLLALAAEQLADSQGKRWLLQGAHGIKSLFLHNKNAPAKEQAQLLETSRRIVVALDQLPVPGRFERLAPFAQRVCGDPHFFDLNTASGRLLFLALTDLKQLEQDTESEEANSNGSGQDLPQTQQRMLLYYDAGLLLDTISSTVAVFNLRAALEQDDGQDQLIQVAGRRVLVLPLRQLLDWQKVLPATEDVYVFENPQVFEEVVDDLLRTEQTAGKRQLPTLVCTAGWPSVAAIRLLGLLAESAAGVQLHYSGDFDVPGLRIAAHLLARYPEKCHLWHFDPHAYRAALHDSSAMLSTVEIQALQALPDDFAQLVAIMQEHAKKAYQEGIISLLLEDVRRA